jgi:hypothetical protein
MRSFPRSTQASPRVVGAVVLACAIFLAYEMGQWVLGNGIKGLGLHIAMLAGVAAALAILVRWRSGILLFLGWLTFEDLVRKYMGNDMYVYFVKDALLAVIYVSFFVSVAQGREKMFRPRFWGPLLALFFLALAQVFNPRSTSVLYGVMGMKLDFYYVPLIFVGYSFLRDREDLDRFISFSLKVAIAVCLVGITQAVGWRNFLNPKNLAPRFVALGELVRTAPGVRGALSAPPSVFVSQGRYANYLQLMFTLALGAAAFELFRRRSAKLVYAALGVLGVAIYLSGSKSALVYAIVTLVGIGAALSWGLRNQAWISARLRKIMWRSLIALAASLCVLFYLFPNLTSAWGTYYYEMLWPDSSTSMLASRTGSYPLSEFEKVLEYAHWPSGYGTGTASLGVDYVTGLMKAPPPPANPVENGFGDILIEWGVLGLVLWVTMSIALVLAGWQTTKLLAGTPFYPIALAIVWFAFWVLLPFTWGTIAVYQNYIINAYVWLLVGVLFRLPGLMNQPRPETQQFAAPTAAHPAELLRLGRSR